MFAMTNYKIPKNIKTYEYEYPGADHETGDPMQITYSFCRINDNLISAWEGEVDMIFEDVDDLCCDFIIGLITGRLPDDSVARKFGFDSARDACDKFMEVYDSVEGMARFFESVQACGKVYPEPDVDDLYGCLAPFNNNIWS